MNEAVKPMIFIDNEGISDASITMALSFVEVRNSFGDLPQDEFLNLLYGADE